MVIFHRYPNSLRLSLKALHCNTFVSSRPATATTSPIANNLLALSSTTTCSFTTTSSRRGGGGGGDDHHGHEDHYNPPTGWLWGIPPGQKYEKEGWEGIMYWGFCGSLVLAVIGYIYKPDTSIQTWALEEARRRLEREGILPDPDDDVKESG